MKNNCLPEILVDSKALAELAAKVCCAEKRIQELEDAPAPECEDCEPFNNCVYGCTNLAFFADSGEGGTQEQIDLWNRIQARPPEMLLMGGDNTYTNPATCAEQQIDADIFAPYRQTGMLFPALGNHDLDVDPAASCHYTLYPYLPGNRRYYTVKFPEKGLQIFVLNSGRNSAGTLLEVDGNSIDSEQYLWFIEEAAKSTAKWKIVMFHHPWFSQQSAASDGSQYLSEMDWKFENYGIDLVVNGHNHMTNHHIWNGVNYVQASLSVRPPRQFRTDSTLTYGLPYGAMVWGDQRNGRTGEPMVGFIELTDRAMKVEMVDNITGDVLHTFIVQNDRLFLCDPDEEVTCPCSHISYSSI
jgi:hypothetical protein